MLNLKEILIFKDQTLKVLKKKNTSKKNLLIKSVKFKETPICLNNIIERKKTLREEKKRKTERS